MKQALRNVAFWLTAKRVDESKLSVVNIQLKSGDVSFFGLSSNTVISFSYKGKTCYFRECSRLEKRDGYFLNAISSFFNSLGRLGIDKRHFKQSFPIDLSFANELVESFKEYIDNKKESKAFLKMLSATDKLVSKHRFSVWSNASAPKALFESLGLGDMDSTFYDIAVYFVWCMRSAAYNYRTLRIARGKNYSFFGAVRSVSTYIVAQEMGLSSMIPHTRFCVLDIEGEKLFGVLSDAAPGARMIDSVVTPNASLQAELTALNMLDVITYQNDHGPNNYNVCVNENGAYTVCAFDNDNPSTFFVFFGVEGAFSGCEPLVKNGVIARPYMKKELAQRLNSLELDMLKRRLSPYLNRLQIYALTQRIKKLRKAVLKAEKLNPDFFSEDVSLAESVSLKEADGVFGVTYLTKSITSK